MVRGVVKRGMWHVVAYTSQAAKRNYANWSINDQVETDVTNLIAAGWKSDSRADVQTLIFILDLRVLRVSVWVNVVLMLVAFCVDMEICSED